MLCCRKMCRTYRHTEYMAKMAVSGSNKNKYTIHEEYLIDITL